MISWGGDKIFHATRATWGLNHTHDYLNPLKPLNLQTLLLADFSPGYFDVEEDDWVEESILIEPRPQSTK